MQRQEGGAKGPLTGQKYARRVVRAHQCVRIMSERRNMGQLCTDRGVLMERNAGIARIPWGDVILASIAAVSWALVGMGGVAALALRLVGADTAGGIGPMTAAVVVLAVGGSVTPSGDVSAFGLEGAAAETAVEITPLGVAVVGALLLAYFFLRSLKGAGWYVTGAELAARVGALVALFLAVVSGLAWAGHDVVTFDGAALGLDVPGGEGGLEVPGLGDVGGLLPDRLGDLVDAKASVGFAVEAGPSLVGALVWVLVVVTLVLLAARRAPLPPGQAWDAVHRIVRPAVSALATVVLVAVAAGYAAAGYAAATDASPGRIAGVALLGAPNGVGLGVPLGLFVPWRGRASGELAAVLPDPVDELLRVSADEPVTLARLAELDRGVWLLPVAVALMMLCAGVLAAVRTPRAGLGPAAFAGRCAARLGGVTAVALPLLVAVSGLSVGASLSVLGVDAFEAGIELRGDLGVALLLGVVWGAGAGAAGALLAYAAGRAGTRAVLPPVPRPVGELVAPGPYRLSEPYRPAGEHNPYLDPPAGPGPAGGLHAAETVAGPLRPLRPPRPPGPVGGDARRRPAPPDEEPPTGPPPPGTPRGFR
ncbi:hypothetical protein GCM10014713_66250 [Streptomyces purpureus]|uniref:Integral membrane protein n=2 Tax=Streptomyces purpureus TaxID=1951 RepID=A0A918LXB9_9ACTN|nr:hypothetical protein GCM10014713_66250 [Streptomyces purpureus]